MAQSSGFTPLHRLRLALSCVATLLALLPCGCSDSASTVVETYASSIGDSARGQHLIYAYGCGSCHVIPGVPDANGAVGPPLDNFGARAYIAGTLQNQPANLFRWIVNPQEIEPGTAMPVLGVSEEQARDIAAYLYTLR